MNQILDSEKEITPPFAYFLKRFVYLKLHDAVWISKACNIIPILNTLNSKVKEAKNKNQKVVLISYSAGSIITYQYMLHRLPYLTTTTFFKDSKFTQKEIDYINKHPKKKTCIAALLHSEMGDVSELGKLLKNKNEQEFIEAYSQLDTITDDYCTPPDTLYGVINIANIINLFCSNDLYNDKYFYSSFNSLLYNYLIENGTFVLSINFADDVLSLPNPSDNTAYKNTKKGFIAESNDTQVHACFVKAHVKYWTKPQKTANLIIKTYLDGYKKNIGELPVLSKKNKTQKKL